MNECYFCGASGNTAHIASIKVRGRRDGVRIQKNIKICLLVKTVAISPMMTVSEL